MSPSETNSQSPLDRLHSLDAVEQAELAELDKPFDRRDLELVARRELAVGAVGMVEEVLEVDVTVGALIRFSSDEEPRVRLRAKRALRCVESIGREESPVVTQVGRASLYHYVEGVIEYGASERTFLKLMELYKLNAEEVTGLYALRSGIAQECGDVRPGFPELLTGLAMVGISPADAAADNDAALAAMQEAGFFVDHGPRRTYDRTKFWPGHEELPLMKNQDTVPGYEQRAWVREQLAEGPGRLVGDDEEGLED